MANTGRVTDTVFKATYMLHGSDKSMVAIYFKALDFSDAWLAVPGHKRALSYGDPVLMWLNPRDDSEGKPLGVFLKTN